jgi:hypothetical protein
LAIKATKVREATSEITLLVDDEELWIKYRPGVLTPETTKSMRSLDQRFRKAKKKAIDNPDDEAAQNEAEKLEAEIEDKIVGSVKEMFVEWDVLDDDGNRIPPKDCIDTLPFEFTFSVYWGVVQAIQPGETKRVTSADG